MKKILVTGAAGFIGEALVKRLSVNKKIKIYAIDKKKMSFKKNNIKFFKKDLRFVKKFPRVDIVIHLAAFNGTKHFYNKPLEVIEHNFIPTMNLINFYKQNPCALFVYSGTSEIYAGNKFKSTKKLNLKENDKIIFDDIQNPRWSYATSKFMSEVAVINSKLKYIILRYFNVYGPNQIDHFIPEFISRLKINRYELYGYKNKRSFIFIDDAINATIKLINNQKSKNQIFNVGSEKEISILNCAKQILKIIKINKKIKLYDSPLGSPKRRKPNISKTKKLIGEFNKISLKEGLKKILNN